MKRILSVILAVSSLLFVCSCGEKQFSATKKYSIPESIAVIESGIVAENNNYILTYDSSVDNLILYNKSTQQLVSTIPYGHYSSEEEATEYVNGRLNSSVVISCVNNKDSSVADYYSYDSTVLKNTAYSVKIDGGVRVIYFFSEPEISIPVDYTLTEKGLQAKVLVSEITEGSTYRVYKLSLLPFFASAKNNTDSYLFVPSGSGALMYTDDNKRDIRIYSEAVYGDDATFDAVYELNKTEQIHLPVFGVKNQKQGIFAVIEDGSELAYIDASAGDSQIGYSSVYASFYLRGKDIAKIKNQYGANQVIDKIGEYMTDQKVITVNYSLLNEDASYNGMAAAYRDYLKNKGYFTEGEKEGYLFLEILGGAQVDKSFLGISYKTVKSATSVAQAGEIIDDISETADKGLVTVLKGYGKGGLDSTVLAGGFKLDRNIGKASELSQLIEKCSKKGIPLSMDFDLIHFTKSGSGFSTVTDGARNLNNTSAKANYFTLVTNEVDSSKASAYLLKREKTSSAADKVLKALEKYGFEGVSLGSLGNVTYSDYSSQSYFIKAKTVSDYNEIAEKFSKNSKYIVSNSANSYAAVTADYVFNAPTASSSFVSLDKDIPFYQMVFKGNVSIASPSLNLEADCDAEFLKAVSTGTALQFSVIKEFDTDFISSVHSGLAGSVYSDIKPMITEMYEKALPLLQSINGAEIKSYSKSGNLSCTVFSNGVTVYVNFGNKTVSTPFGKVNAKDFIYS